MKNNKTHALNPNDNFGSYLPLAMVEEGKRVKLMKLDGGKDFTDRLSSMGINPGIEIIVERNSYRGPIIISADNTRLMIGRMMSMKMLVQLIV